MTLTLRELSKYSDEEKRKSYKFECEWRQCKFLSGNDRKYFEHVDTHSENLEVNSDDTFVCEWDLCDFVTESRDELIGHVHFHGYHTMLKVHGASLSLLANLPRCNLDSRMRNSIGNRPMTYICDWDSCHERFNKAMYFFYHVKNHLIDAYPQGRKSGYRGEKVMCRWSNCKIGYNALTTMKIHIRAHTTEREVACFCCGTMFRERLKYLDHCARQVDVSYRKYQCLQCGKFCTTDRLLKNHMDTHYKEYECTLCPIGFSSKAALSTHIMRRHFQVRNYKCQQCDYRAFTKADLMVHTLSHNARKLYRCDEFGCNVAFKTETSLKKHISWHYNLPTPLYECHLCSNKYAQSFHLSKHYLFDHKLERQPGYRTYRYKIDSDGIHRLAWYVEKKTQDCVKPSIEQLEAQSTMKHKSASNPPVEKSKPSKSTYAALKGVPQVECIKSIGVDEFLVELKLIEEPKDESEKTGQEEQSK
ncbi:histone H4 transcription factor [Anopheles nili]|uniref:histone H4 transcription factor n=1 Tax=Anopheles nili TaxID=185578 RepID=UPI00237BA9DD|nr:histone H4 transcription factor [Anopheles nili]